MRSLLSAGDPSGALTQARIYESLLAQELELEPDRHVVELANRIRRGELSAPPTLESLPPEPTRRAPNDSSVAVRQPRRAHRLVAAVIGGLAIIGLGVTAWRANARSSAAPVLAVGRLVDYRGTERRDADALADMLATNLARVEGLHVLSSARLYEVLNQLGEATESRAATARAAVRAGANELLEGGLHPLAGGRLLLELRRVDLASGTVRTAYRVEASDVYALVSEATEDLARSLSRASGRLDPADVSTRSLVAYRFYEEGLRSFSRGDYRSADRLFGAAVAEDSTFAMAAFYVVMTVTRWVRRAQPLIWSALLASLTVRRNASAC
jgi:TolB-like protein